VAKPASAPKRGEMRKRHSWGLRGNLLTAVLLLGPAPVCAQIFAVRYPFETNSRDPMSWKVSLLHKFDLTQGAMPRIVDLSPNGSSGRTTDRV
jgi:hypothetical protein